MQSNPKTSRSIQETLSDLHSIFIWGEKAAPFLEDLIEFIESLTPLIEEINISLQESTKRFPSAQSQLDDVTKATELATNEILGLLEKSLDECNVIDKENKASSKAVENFAEFKTSIRTEIRGALSGSDPRVHVLLAKLWHQTDKLVTGLQESGEKKKKSVSSLRSGLNKILMSLQVQDITTQQISAVIHVIQSVKSRLSELYDRLSSIKEIEGPEFSLIDSREESLLSLSLSQSKESANKSSEDTDDSDDPIPLESGNTFDANASYDKSKSKIRQSEADDVVEKMLAGELASNKDDEGSADTTTSEEETGGLASIDDIDSLFASGGSEASNSDIDNLFASNNEEESSDEEVSSDEIDDLFSSGGDAASSEDIDKLFGA